MAHHKPGFLACVSVLTLISVGLSGTALAQTAPTASATQPADTEPGEIVVTGLRRSLETAQSIKRNADQVIDSIVAEDIGKLPDNNIAEALQRIPGIQITRNRGEGSSVSIRGLSQTATLINGRNVPGLSVGSVPSQILAGIDVYKNPSAAIIEGGLGGVVNLRTRRPFDFKSFEASATVRANYNDFSDKVGPVVSGLVSNRFDTGIGEVGLLLNATYIRSSAREDQVGIEPYFDRYNIFDFDGDGFFPGTNADPGDLVVVPSGGGGQVDVAERERIVVNGAAQWRPSDTFELLVEAVYNKFDFKLSNETVFLNRGRLQPAPGVAFEFAPGTNVAVAGAFRDISFSENSNFTDILTDFWQTSGVARWTPFERLTVVGDLAYSESKSNNSFGNVRLGNANPVTNGPTLFFDTRPDLPTLRLSNTPTDISDFFYYNSVSGAEVIDDTNLAAAADAEYRVGGFVRSVELGVRYQRLTTDRRRGRRERIGSRVPASVWPEGFQPFRYNDFFNGANMNTLPLLPVVPPALARDTQRQCQVFNDAVCDFTFAPIDTYSQEQKTWAAYGLVNFDFELLGMPVAGNVGARYVNTDLSVEGFRLSPNAPAVSLNQANKYSNLLPSLNLRAELRGDLFLRAAAAKQLTRPSLAQLAPNLTLAVSTAFGLIGQAGNPDLAPLRSNSYDLGLEYYFSRVGYAYVSGFIKEVDGFIQTVSRDEPVSLAEFPGFTTARITRPQNGDNGTIKGFEVGVQAFFDFLPAPFDGFGAQVNYTYVDSKAPGVIAGTTVPLVGLSKNSVNLVGFYEKGPWRARVAYNWRDDYVETTSATGSGSLPIFVKPIGFLDASLGYQFNENFELTLDASNLTRARFASYFGETIRRRFDNVTDRRFGVSLRVRL